MDRLALGTGVDLVSIARMRHITEGKSREYLLHLFSPVECDYAMKKADPAQTFAGLYAAKEAVFKALAPLLKEEAGKSFDLRLVHTLHGEDGAPYLEMTPQIKTLLQKAGAQKVLLSISHDGEYACAFAVVA